MCFCFFYVCCECVAWSDEKVRMRFGGLWGLVDGDGDSGWAAFRPFCYRVGYDSIERFLCSAVNV